MAHSAIKQAIGNGSAFSESFSAESQVGELGCPPGQPGVYMLPPGATYPKRGSVMCDYRIGCAIIAETFPNTIELAQQKLRSNPHLAESLFQLGLTAYGNASIDMALAIQESRADPPRCCSCLHCTKAS